MGRIAGFTSTGSKRPEALFGAEEPGLPARMVRAAGYTVVDRVSVLGTHLAELIRRHAHEKQSGRLQHRHGVTDIGGSILGTLDQDLKRKSRYQSFVVNLCPVGEPQ